MSADPLDGLATFVAVVEAGGFAAAARRLALTTSAVSKQVQRLESRLAARLLLRSTRRLALTEAGEAFYERARRALDEAVAARDAVADLGAEPRGTLRLATPMSFGILHVAAALAAFMKQHPGVRAEMVLDDRLQDLVAGGFDLAIRIGALGGSGSVVARRIGSAAQLLCASPDYLARRGTPQSPADLLAHDVLLYGHDASAPDWSFDGPQGPAGVRPAPRLACNNSLALRELALAGSGVLRVPDFVVDADLAAGRLQRVLPDWRLAPVGIHAVFPDRAWVPLKARAFADFLQRRLAGSATDQRSASTVASKK